MTPPYAQMKLSTTAPRKLYLVINFAQRIDDYYAMNDATIDDVIPRKKSQTLHEHYLLLSNINNDPPSIPSASAIAHSQATATAYA